MSELNEEAVQRALRSGMYASRDEIAISLSALSELREHSLLGAVVRGDTMGAVSRVYPTLLRIRRMAGNYEPLDLSFFRGGE